MIVASTPMHAYINSVSYDVFRDDSRRKSILANTIEPIHLTFGLAVTPLPLQGCGDGMEVATKSAGESVELGHAAHFSSEQPWLEAHTLPPAHEVTELLGESLDGLRVRPDGGEVFKEELFFG